MMHLWINRQSPICGEYKIASAPAPRPRKLLLNCTVRHAKYTKSVYLAYSLSLSWLSWSSLHNRTLGRAGQLDRWLVSVLSKGRWKHWSEGRETNDNSCRQSRVWCPVMYEVHTSADRVKDSSLLRYNEGCSFREKTIYLFLSIENNRDVHIISTPLW